MAYRGVAFGLAGLQGVDVMYVKFKGDGRELARLAILASVPDLEDVSLDVIHNPNWVQYWNFKGKQYVVNFLCSDDWLLHPITGNLRRPWAQTYPTALALVEAARLEVVESLTLYEWNKRLLMDTPSRVD